MQQSQSSTSYNKTTITSFRVTKCLQYNDLLQCSFTIPFSAFVLLLIPNSPTVLRTVFEAIDKFNQMRVAKDNEPGDCCLQRASWRCGYPCNKCSTCSGTQFEMRTCEHDEVRNKRLLVRSAHGAAETEKAFCCPCSMHCQLLSQHLPTLLSADQALLHSTSTSSSSRWQRKKARLLQERSCRDSCWEQKCSSWFAKLLKTKLIKSETYLEFLMGAILTL